jgi:hypothetical protein
VTNQTIGSPIEVEPGVTLTVERIGPAGARELLSRNETNRRVNPYRVKVYGTDMAAGRWPFVGDPVCVSKDGKLQQGQHRLQAVIDKDVTITFVVIRGLTHESQAVMDIHRPRALRDTLAMNGAPDPSTLGPALPYVWGWEHGVNFAVSQGNWRPSNTELLTTLLEHPGLCDSLTTARSLARATRIPRPVGAFRHYQLGMIDNGDRDDFFERLRTREFRGSTDPLAALYDVMMKDGAKPNRRMDTVHKHALLVKAWNYYRDGREVKQLRWSRGGRNVEPFPEAI